MRKLTIVMENETTIVNALGSGDVEKKIYQNKNREKTELDVGECAWEQKYS